MCETCKQKPPGSDQNCEHVAVIIIAKKAYEIIEEVIAEKEVGQLLQTLSSHHTSAPQEFTRWKCARAASQALTAAT